MQELETRNSLLLADKSEGRVPSLDELVMGLARTPRWLGETIRPWSVLQHSLVVFDLTAGDTAETRLFGLCHDIEEALTGDIPRPHKTEAQADYERTLRRWIYRDTLGLPYPVERSRRRVERADDIALIAEARVLCRPEVYEDAIRRGVRGEAPTDEELDRAASQVWQIAGMDFREQTDVFLRIYGAILETPQGKQLRASGR